MTKLTKKFLIAVLLAPMFLSSAMALTFGVAGFISLFQGGFASPSFLTVMQFWYPLLTFGTEPYPILGIVITVIGFAELKYFSIEQDNHRRRRK